MLPVDGGALLVDFNFFDDGELSFFFLGVLGFRDARSEVVEGTVFPEVSYSAGRARHRRLSFGDIRMGFEAERLLLFGKCFAELCREGTEAEDSASLRAIRVSRLRPAFFPLSTYRSRRR